MNTLKAVADPSAQILWSADAQAGPAAPPTFNSSSSGAGTVGRNATTGSGNGANAVVVVVAANGTIVGTQSAGAPLPSVTSIVGAASTSLTFGSFVFVPTVAVAALALLRA